MAAGDRSERVGAVRTGADPAGCFEPGQPPVFPGGPAADTVGFERGAVSDAESGGVQVEHPAQAGEVEQWIVVEGRVGRPGTRPKKELAIRSPATRSPSPVRTETDPDTATKPAAC